MKPISIQQVRQAVGGRVLAVVPSPAPVISAVCTDSRQMLPQSLFIAIKGDTHDGHQHLGAAAAGGAIAALVQEVPVGADRSGLHLIQVADTRLAMGKLATFVRKQMRSKVIGVVGSNGKTSTKYLVNAALCKRFRGSMSPKSFNNDIGVPLTIFPADPLQDYLVLEMGTNHHGEIRRLTDMALPDIAVITNCSAEHLEFLGDLMGVRRENASVIAGLNPKGLLVVNGDDPELLAAVEAYPGKRITFGFKDTNDLFATDVRCTDGGVEFRLNSGREIFVPMLGRHTAANALAAIAVARRMGMSEEAIAESLAVAEGPEMRLQMQEVGGGIRLLNDAYNANPASMRAAIALLGQAKPEGRGRRIAVLGDMLELGRAAAELHASLADALDASRADLVFLAGPEMAALWRDLPDERRGAYAEKAAELEPILLEAIGPGDVVMIKASLGTRLGPVVEAVKGHFRGEAA